MLFQAKYHCICAAGWMTDGSDPACDVDANECEMRGAPVCSVNPPVTCINVPGSFYCGACPLGESRFTKVFSRPVIIPPI